MDLSAIEQNYQAMATEDLIRLSKKPSDLRIEVIPILQNELLNRGKREDAMELSNYLIKTKTSEDIDMSTDEFTNLINERIDSGESVDSIKIDLKEKGINLVDVVIEDEKLRKKAFDLIIDLNKQGLLEKELDKKVMAAFSISQGDVDILKSQLRQRGRNNQVSGYDLVIISIIFMIVFFSIGGYVTITAILALVGGISMIVNGHDQLRKPNEKYF